MISIRDAVRSDLEAVLRFWQEAEALPTNTDDAGALERLLDHPTSVLLLAVDGSRLAGTVIGGFDGWRGGIYRLAVHPSRRRGGLGGRLVAAACERLEEMGARRIAAFARAEEAQALAFWDSGAGADFVPAASSVRYVRG